MIIKKHSKYFQLILLLLINFNQAYPQEIDIKQKSIEELIALRKNADQICMAKIGKTKKWGNSQIPALIESKTHIIFEDNFKNFDNWHHEGIGNLTQPEANLMQLNCVGSGQGKVGCMAFCKKDFPANISIEYDLKVLTTAGLMITFIACQGRNGEDMITELPEREGSFADYVYNEKLRCYHVSLSRYNDDGIHTGVSNWRRNPGLFLMAEQPDLCKQPNKWYHITIIKKTGLLQMAVDGTVAGGFIDLNKIPEPLPISGKIGFRAIGRHVIAQIKNFKVSLIEN